MRWAPFFILAYLALGVQLGIAGAGDLHGARPNFVLLAAVFVALNAPREPALLACFILGIFQDLLTLEPLGLMAVAYALVGMFVISTQEAVYREHPLTHVSLGLIGALIAAIVMIMHGWIYPLLHRQEIFVRPPLGPVLLGVVYTAIAAPFVLWGLQRMKRIFGFRSGRAPGGRVMRSAGPRT